MDAEQESRRLESETMEKVLALIEKANAAILQKLRALLRQLRLVEEQEPPVEYSEEQAAEWREEQFQSLLRKHRAEERVSAEIAFAGAAAALLILRMRDRVYKVNQDSATVRLIREAAQGGKRIRLPTLTERQIRNILTDSQPYFARVAYHNLGSVDRYRRRFQQALASATLHGETQEKLVKRLEAVIGSTSREAQNHARLIAQTERVRAQSQAQMQASDDAEALGVRLYDEWSCAMIPPHKTRSGYSGGSRESHIALDGTRVMHGEGFDTIWGNHLRYPGDPSAPAKEICNCHCRVTSHVLLDNERIVNGVVEKWP